MVSNFSKKKLCILVLNNDYLDHHLHCHHGNDDTVHLYKGESQTLKGTCILLTCIDPDTDEMQETRYVWFYI